MPRRLFFLACSLVLAGCGPKPQAIPAVSAVSEAIAFPAGKEQARGWLCRPSTGGRHPGIVFVHGERGLTGWEKGQAQRLAEHGYVVLAVDLYRGEVMQGVEDAHIMGRGLPEEQALGDVKAAVDFLAQCDDVRPDALGILGWDMGCGYALDAACADPRLRAAVVCEGRLITDPELLRPLQAVVLGIFAENDEGITLNTRDQFRAAMAKAGGKLAGISVFDGVGHGFMNSEENSEAGAVRASEEAWQTVFAFFDQELKK